LPGKKSKDEEGPGDESILDDYLEYGSKKPWSSRFVKLYFMFRGKIDKYSDDNIHDKGSIWTPGVLFDDFFLASLRNTSRNSMRPMDEGFSLGRAPYCGHSL
jgi:hypothetical protein